MYKINENEKRVLNIFISYEEISDEVTRLITSTGGSYGYTALRKMKEKNLLTECDRKVDIRKNNRTKGGKRSKNKKTPENEKISENVVEPNRPNYYNYKALHINPKVKRQLLLGEDAEERKANTSSLESVMKRSDTVLMCCLAGVVGFEKYSDEEQTYYQLDDMEAGYTNINPFVEDVGQFNPDLFRRVMNEFGVVIPYSEIRKRFSGTTEDQSHFNFSCATAFLAGKHNPYFMFHANHGYLSTRAKGERRMAEAILHYMGMLGIYRLTGIRTKVGRGIIFVRNKNDFKRLIFNTYHCNRARFADFEVMHIIPETPKGLQYLSAINNYPDITQSIISKFVSVGNCQHNQDVFSAKYFPLTYESGRKLYYGIDMNYNTLAEVYYAFMRGEVEFDILCLEWQEEYYRSIFGEDMHIAVVKEEVIETAWRV